MTGFHDIDYQLNTWFYRSTMQASYSLYAHTSFTTTTASSCFQGSHWNQMRCTNLQEGILVKLPKPLQLFYFNSSVWACRHYIEIKAAVDKSCVNWAVFWQVTIIFTSSDIFLVTAYRKSNAFVYYCTLRKVSDSLSKSNSLNCLLNSCIVFNDYTRATSSMFYLLIKNMNLLIYCQSPFELSCLLVKKCDHFC